MQTRSMNDESDGTEQSLGLDKPGAFEGRGELKKNVQSGSCKTVSISSRCSSKIVKALKIAEVEERRVKLEVELQRAIVDVERRTELARIEIGSPLFSVLSDAIRCNEQYRSCHSEVIRQTAIEWFHGTRDRYGGRAKRRRVADMGSLEHSTSSFELSQTISEDTEPAVDEHFRQHNDAV
nr:unnamed protein product [Spirometra erinaceieuropaei]